MNRWKVYILRCADGTLYTGVTTDPERRLAEHNAGPRGARYTRSRRPVRLIWLEVARDRSSALRREREIKGWTPARRRRFVHDAMQNRQGH